MEYNNEMFLQLAIKYYFQGYSVSEAFRKAKEELNDYNEVIVNE